MKHTWADPKKEWDDFQLTAYGLNWEKLTALQVTEQRVVGDGKQEELATTLGDVFKKLADQKFEVESRHPGITIKMGTEELTYTRPSFPASLLAELIRLGKEGVSPLDSLWFWYNSDSCRYDPHERYAFFVVYRDRIVRESVSFSDTLWNGFDPDVFESSGQSDSIWVNDEAWNQANTRYWYRKFYTETRTGQLMLLRDDQPKLCDYQSHPDPDMSVLLSQKMDMSILLSQKMVNSLKTIHDLLWVLIVLGGLILIRFWR